MAQSGTKLTEASKKPSDVARLGFLGEDRGSLFLKDPLSVVERLKKEPEFSLKNLSSRSTSIRRSLVIQNGCALFMDGTTNQLLTSIGESIKSDVYSIGVFTHMDEISHKMTLWTGAVRHTAGSKTKSLICIASSWYWGDGFLHQLGQPSTRGEWTILRHSSEPWPILDDHHQDKRGFCSISLEDLANYVLPKAKRLKTYNALL